MVPGVLGQPEGAARQLLDQAGLDAAVLAGCATDPARAAAEPGRVWRSGRVRLWVTPRLPALPTTPTTPAGEG
jgi:hypothetical protein